MAVEGVDYAWDRPNLDELWAAGKRFVCRYLAYLPNGKVLSSSERQALHTRGFGIVLNWEQATGDMLRGYDVGVRHAREALRQANVLGAPASIPIYFSCDVDTSVRQRLEVALYLDGCASVLGRQRVGVYGEADVIDVMVPAHATWGWQTYAWSSGRVSPKAHFLQYRNGVQLAGADLDLDRQLKPDIGAWHPVQAITEEEPSMTSWTQPLSQGTPGYAGQQRDTALAFAWQFANEANQGVQKLVTAAAASEARDRADEARDQAVLAALQAMASAGGPDVAPVVAAVNAVRDEARAQYGDLLQRLAAMESRAVAAEAERDMLHVRLSQAYAGPTDATAGSDGA